MLLGLDGLWGASYLFMRIGGSEFGPWVFGGLRAAGAALCLMPLLAIGGQRPGVTRAEVERSPACLSCCFTLCLDNQDT